MYVAWAKVFRGKCYKGIRKRAMGRYSKVVYNYSNFVVCLVEGKAPEDFFPHDHDDCNWKMENRLKQLRAREIPWDLQYDRPKWGTKRC